MTTEQLFFSEIRAACTAGRGEDPLVVARHAGFNGFADHLKDAAASVSAAGRYGRIFGARVATGQAGTLAVGMRLILDRETGIPGVEEVIVAASGPGAEACEAGIVRALAAVFGWGGGLPARAQMVLGITGRDVSRPSVLDMAPLCWSDRVSPADASIDDGQATGFAALVAGAALLNGFEALGFRDLALPVGPGAFLPTLNPA